MDESNKLKELVKGRLITTQTEIFTVTEYQQNTGSLQIRKVFDNNGIQFALGNTYALNF